MHNYVGQDSEQKGEGRKTRQRKRPPEAQDLIGLHFGGRNAQCAVYMVEPLTTVKGLEASMSSGSYLHRDSNRSRPLNMLVDLRPFLHTNNINALEHTTAKYCQSSDLFLYTDKFIL
jgi:hypothetical protein